jgi:hypothetical protein
LIGNAVTNCKFDQDFVQNSIESFNVSQPVFELYVKTDSATRSIGDQI